MVCFMDLSQLRAQWSDVLDALERRDRMAWLVLFDARLASMDNGILKLDYLDSKKFASGLDYGEIKERHQRSLIEAIKEVCGIDIQIDVV